jgi:hypothetical protein
MSIVIASPIHQVLSSKKKRRPLLGCLQILTSKKNIFVIMISIKMARHAEKSCVMHIYIYTHTYVCVYCHAFHFISVSSPCKTTPGHVASSSPAQVDPKNQSAPNRRCPTFSRSAPESGSQFQGPSQVRRLQNFRFGRVEKKQLRYCGDLRTNQVFLTQ